MIRICNPLLAFGLKIEDWRFHRNSFLKSSTLPICGGDWRSEEEILWNLQSEEEKASIRLPIPFHPSVHPIHPPILSIHPSFPFIYIAICSPICLSTYISTNLSSYLSFDPSIYLIVYFHTTLQSFPWVACGLKIQERTIFNPKKGTGGTDNKKHWEAVLTTRASARIQTIQTDYKAKLHRFRHLLMQIAWFVSFSNFPSAADGHILLNAPDFFRPPKLSRREPAQYWPRGLVGKCLEYCQLLMHGGTQTIRFWGLQHVHWCEGSCCWFLRLQSRLVWGGYPRPEGLGKLMMLSAKEEKGNIWELGIHVISKKTQLSWESKLKAQTSLFDPV